MELCYLLPLKAKAEVIEIPHIPEEDWYKVDRLSLQPQTPLN